jgi:hypothetical protein
LTDVPILFSLLRVSNPGPIRLVEYPWVVVRLACDGCKRRGAYRLARLAEKFGAEAELEHVLDRLASDCIARGGKVKLKADEQCRARFPDLDHWPPAEPPDLPPGMLGPRLVGESFDRAVADLIEPRRRRKAAQQR